MGEVRTPPELSIGQFFGDVASRTTCSGVVLTEVRHREPRALPPHAHRAAFFCLLIEGSYAERIGGRAFEYKPFAVGWHPSGLRHSDAIGSNGALFFSIELGEDWSRGMQDYSVSDALPPEVFEGRMTATAARLYDAHRRRAITPLLAEELALDLVAQAARARYARETDRPRWLQRCLDLLHDQFFEPLTIARIAEEVGVHPVHLSREFRRRYRQTMGEYVNDVRLRYACEQLTGTGRPLADIALASGFSDQSHFCRVFKSVIRASPGAFRRATQSNVHRWA